MCMWVSSSVVGLSSLRVLGIVGALGDAFQYTGLSLRPSGVETAVEEEAVGARKRKGHGEAGADAANNKPRSLNPHEREASRWASICSHQRRRSRCKECGGREHVPTPPPSPRLI